MAVPAGSDSILFERLAQALAPQYTLKREIARGGMGVVYLAHDKALDRPVAVKLLMPEHASAALAARFVREAQVLARLRHPNIVTVHQVSESAGLFFYVMEWLDGETLQDRLARGRLPQAEATRIGAELLDALGVAHKHGWIHRDVKPGNIFLTEDRAILTDFGIARPISEDATSLTGTRQMIGTLAYMSPEQRDGGPVTEASDIYSAGLVVYEMMSGRRWWQRDSDTHDWSGVPSRVKMTLRKAMQHEPGDRYRSALHFRKALAGSSWLGGHPVIIAAAVLLLMLTGGTLLYLRPGPPPSGRIVRLQALDSRGAGAWGDSIGAAVTRRLAGFPDLVVSGPFDRRAKELDGAGLVLTGTVEAVGDQLRATVQSRPGPSRPINITRTAAANDWPTLADSLAAQLVYDIYFSETDDPSLPGEALPRTPEGLQAWIRAEQLFTQARWEKAARAYREAEELDPTCLLCVFRINDIDRWLDRQHDPARMERLQAHVDDFPTHYRLLIQAAAARWPERIALMDSAVQTRDFFLAWFHRGDEIFHRGPLFGRHRSEATADLEQTVNLRPDFMPGWEHLAWLKIAEGDSAGAAQAIGKLPRDMVDVDQTSAALGLLLKAAFAYRFEASGSGDAIINGALQIPLVADFPALAMAPRLMLTFEAPGAALDMGRIFARRTAVAEIRSGILAQAFGYLALGQPDSALRYAGVLRSRVPGIESDLFAAQLAGALALANQDSSGTWAKGALRAREVLRQLILHQAAGDDVRRRAAWMLVLLAERTRGENQVPLAHFLLQKGTGTDSLYLKLIQADQLARRGLYDRALGMTNWNGDDLVRLPDPFFSTITHLLRAEWYSRMGNTRDALSTLLWHEADDFGTFPLGEALAPEVDLAFGTLARWNQAQMLDNDPAFLSDVCRGYRAVARLWSNGNEVHRARAAIATSRLSALPCDDG